MPPRTRSVRERVVKLYVAEELAKTKNGKGCLVLAGQARELLASSDQPAERQLEMNIE